MKNRIFLLLVLLAFTLTAGSQTLQQGRNYFNAGKYAEAKPIMLKYLKQSPNDASRNYWYGVCCYETGEPDKAIPYLEKAAAKKIAKANKVLGHIYLLHEDYQHAINYFETYVSGISADKELHDPAIEERYTQMSDSLRTLFRMIRNASRVTFVDSIVVPKADFLQAYLFSPSTGSVYTRQDFFADNTLGEVFLPEMQQVLTSSRLGADSLYHLYSQYKSLDRWDDETPLIGLESDGDMRYPFVMNDGITIYYAASGSESMGGLDIFASRFNSATGRYLKPENIGMPFNSSANDYLYVIDETNNLGWFATDRNQPEDTVCVYMFIPTDRSRKYNYESGDTMAIHRAARLESIAETQTDLNEVRAARQRLIMLRYELAESAQQGSFNYIIDDLTTYHELTDFRSTDAASMFERWTELRQEYESNASSLEQQRTAYSNASRQEKEQMRSGLLDFEQKVLDQEKQVIKLENDIRTTEINYLNR